MQSLLAFFKRFRLFIFFIFLQIFVWATYLNYSAYPRSQVLTSASSLSGGVFTWKTSLLKYLSLKESNAILQQENARLRKKIPADLYKVSRDTVKIVDDTYQQQFSYVPACVINSSVTKSNNYFTLDCGGLQGITTGMGVISPKGVVGIIHNTSDHYSVVKTLLTENINIDVEVLASNLFGFIKWDGKNPLKGNVTGISNDVKVKIGGKVITRGGSGFFPRGIMVGHIESVAQVEGKPLWDVKIKFSEDFRRIRHVYIIKNVLLSEKKLLEEKIPVVKN